MSPRNDDKGNYDDTEFPPDSENADNTQQPAAEELTPPATSATERTMKATTTTRTSESPATSDRLGRPASDRQLPVACGVPGGGPTPRAWGLRLRRWCQSTSTNVSRVSPFGRSLTKSGPAASR